MCSPNFWALPNMQELRWFVKLGMSNEQALQSATVLPAEMLGVEKALGSLAPGFIADIVAVEGDPLADIEATIGNAVIHSKRELGQRSHMNVAAPGYNAVPPAAHRENGRLRRIDDGTEAIRSALPQVGNTEGGALQLLARKPAL